MKAILASFAFCIWLAWILFRSQHEEYKHARIKQRRYDILEWQMIKVVAGLEDVTRIDPSDLRRIVRDYDRVYLDLPWMSVEEQQGYGFSYQIQGLSCAIQILLDNLGVDYDEGDLCGQAFALADAIEGLRHKPLCKSCYFYSGNANLHCAVRPYLPDNCSEYQSR